MARQDAKERLLRGVEEKVLLTCQRGLIDRMLIRDCKLTTKYMLLLLDDSKIKEVGRELECY